MNMKIGDQNPIENDVRIQNDFSFELIQHGFSISELSVKNFHKINKLSFFYLILAGIHAAYLDTSVKIRNFT